jgi:hypothetical protein
MMDIDEALRWGPYALLFAGVALALLVVGAHVAFSRTFVALRNRAARRAMRPVTTLTDVLPDGVVCVEGALALPPRSALRDRTDLPPEHERPVVETPHRRLRLDGPVRVTAASVESATRRDPQRSVMRGARVRVRGRVRVERSGESDAYRAEGAVWSLVPEGETLEVAAMETKRIRGHRWGLSFALAAVFALAPTGLAVWAGRRAFAGVGAPTVALTAVRGDVARWRRVWTREDRRRLALAALSPLLRSKVRAQRAREEELETAFPPMRPEEAERVAGTLRGNGDCLHEAELRLRTGRPAEALALADGCADPAAKDIARESRCLLRPCDGSSCALSYLADEPRRARWSAVLGALNAGSGCGAESPRVSDPGPVDAEVDAVGCAITTLLRDPTLPEGSRVTPLPAARWDDLLAHGDVSCRVLGATRAARRDAASLGALADARRDPSPAVRSLLAHARIYLSLTGIDSGRITGPLCPARTLPSEPDADFLSAHPALALAFVRAAAAGQCAWVSDRVYFPAVTALGRFLSQAAVPDDAMRCGGARCPPETDARGWMWQVDAARAQRTVLRFWDTALHRLDARYTPRRRADFEATSARVLEGLPRYAVTALDAGFAQDGHWPGDFAWSSVLRAMDGLRSPAEWSLRSYPEARGLHGFQMDRGTVWGAPEARSQERAAVLASLVDYWRTGVWAPARDAPAVYRSARMQRVVEAAAGWNTDDVLRVIGPPDAEGVEVLAAVAYRLTGRRPSAAHWLRSAIGYSVPSSRTAAAQVLHLARVVTAARRMRLPEVAAEAESLRAAALDALMSRDPWVSAVLDVSRGG